MRHDVCFGAALSVSLLLSLAASAAPPSAEERVKLLEGAAASQLSKAEIEAPVKGYLPAKQFDFRGVLAPAPAVDSLRDQADVAALRQVVAKTDDARWASAVADEASVYDRFEKELGVTIDRKHVPHLIALLNRVEQELSDPLGGAKDTFARPRPFQRFAFTRVCGKTEPPKPETNPTKGTSYPSGHATLSWAAVLVMAEVAPAKADKLLARGLEYSESRIVCSVHFPSDVEAGRLLATAVVEREQAVTAFRHDLACARAEYEAVAAGKSAAKLKACK